VRLSNSTCAKFASGARSSISFTDATASSYGTTTDARRRESRDVHSATSHSLVAWVRAADNSGFCVPWPEVSGFRIPSTTLFGSKCCFCMNARSLPGMPPGGNASRREACGWPLM
jgi:hypothetical protein